MKTPSPTTAVTTARRRRRRNNTALLFAVAHWMDFIFFLVSVSAYSVHPDHHHQQQQQQKSYASRKRRYFTGEVLLPPLERLHSTESFHHQRQQCHDPNNDAGLETIYTNDPAQVSQWLANHVPSTGCTLGFDLEVRLLYTIHGLVRRVDILVVACCAVCG